MSQGESADAPAKQPGAPQGWWASIKESLHGSHQDFTEGPLGRAIFLLSVPMVLETVLESVFAVVDVFLVGQLGPDAVATVGLTEAMLTLIYAVAMGLSIGATAMVARRIGEKDPEQAARTAVQAIGLGVLLGVPISVAGVYFARPLLELMGGSRAGCWSTAWRYTQIMLGEHGERHSAVPHQRHLPRAQGTRPSPCGCCGWPMRSTSSSPHASSSAGGRSRSWE